MHLPSGVEWAAHCLVVIDQIGALRPVPSATLAAVFDLSPTYLSKHLQKLSAAGLVVSVPGPAGGVQLARPAQKITLADVVDALDGRGPIFRCTEIRCRGLFQERAEEIKDSGPCDIAAAMSRAENAWRASLVQVSITDLGSGVDATSRQQLIEFTHSTNTMEDRP